MVDVPTKMQYVNLGSTGLKVSRLCVGCMGFGDPRWMDWVIQEQESVALLGEIYKRGINFFDTANCYSNGQSEIILGKAIKQFNMNRGRLVVATKAAIAVNDDMSFNPAPRDDPNYVNRFGTSRKHLFDAVDASLKRLDLDYIDLYQIHRFDDDIPLEETMRALHDIVQSGKVRYIGASSIPAWKFQKANQIAEKNGWTKFVAMQNLYNLIYREEEREMMPYCADAGVAVIPWSPLGGGVLTRKRDVKTNRAENAKWMEEAFMKAREQKDNDMIVDEVLAIAEKRGVSAAQVALAWNLSKPYVTAPIVGITKIKHLDDLIEGLDLKLTKEEIEALEKNYAPREVMPFNF
ncbi:hypothetical protein [Absidia glauca]|uniref:NADP-dependent oxidoreductase domain-containing protein n=1 Tax=Absidia glauca TaxID=4829 RepID=A0A163JDU4_ABSGL|nr:hypothetical protein [Absidia glauca]